MSAADFSQAALIGLGANLEDPPGMIGEALRRLSAGPGLELLALSSLYLTEPQGGPRDQNWYHNAVAFFKSGLEPLELLQRLLDLEAEMGRQRREPCGPRLIDLDYLAQGDLVIERPPRLILPHPRMTERLFVMAPLAELAPDWRHPVLGRPASEILASIPPDGQGMKILTRRPNVFDVNSLRRDFTDILSSGKENV